MAEGLLRTLYSDRYESYSAGTIASVINLFAIKVMSEIGIDISKHRSKSIEEFRGMKFDYVVTVCDHARETCPFFPGGGKVTHKSFEDPSGKTPEETEASFRRIRDEIKRWIEKEFGKIGRRL
jgi:arsenate reductase